MAATCPSLGTEPVRAIIQVGSLIFRTPDNNPCDGHIVSFSINRSRNQPVATMSCQLTLFVNRASTAHTVGSLLSSYTSGGVGARVKVWGGAISDETNYEASLPLLFTGHVIQMKQNMFIGDARKYMIDLTCEDVFVHLKNVKFTRRFKITEEPFAIITNGKRRQGGKMTQLKRANPGKSGVTWHNSSSSSSLEHSPLIKTPDASPQTPGGVRPTAGTPSSKPWAETLTAVPNNLTLAPGRQGTVELRQKDGEPLDMNKVTQITTKCNCFIKPYSDGTTGNYSNTAKAIDISKDVMTYPAKVKLEQRDGKYFLNIMSTANYPCTITFVNPLDGSMCTIQISTIPVHTHRTINDGGPAGATFDVSTL
jgi:hypothetical protein